MKTLNQTSTFLNSPLICQQIEKTTSKPSYKLFSDHFVLNMKVPTIPIIKSKGGKQANQATGRTSESTVHHHDPFGLSVTDDEFRNNFSINYQPISLHIISFHLAVESAWILLGCQLRFHPLPNPFTSSMSCKTGHDQNSLFHGNWVFLFHS